MEIKTRPPSDAAGMHSSISEVLRVNFNCNKRNISKAKEALLYRIPQNDA